MRFKSAFSTGWMIAAVMILGGIAYSIIDSVNQTTAIPWMTDFAAAQARAQREHKPLLIDFWATWCTWCYKMDRETYADPQVAALAARCVCVKLDADQNKSVARQFGVGGLPFTVLQGESGPPVFSEGYQPPAEFRQWLEEGLKRVEARQ